MKVYTLPVIDEDGTITGKPGTVIVAQKKLEYKEVTDLRQLKIGEAGPLYLFHAPKKELLVRSFLPDLSQNMFLSSDGKRFEKTVVYSSTHPGFYVWQRVE
jgi:hypothetical protein